VNTPALFFWRVGTSVDESTSYLRTQFDRIGSRQYNNTIVTTSDLSVEDLSLLLAQRRLPSGGWAALSSSSQPALEPTALSCIALGPEFQSANDHATLFLLGIQNSNGSLPIFLGDSREGSWVTSLATSAFQGTGADSTVQGDSEAGRIPGSPVPTIVLAGAGQGSPPLPIKCPTEFLLPALA
jgi:hypothetical protein